MISEPRSPWKVIYKITYPNGKIHVGQDRTDTLDHMRSLNSALIEVDFPAHDREARVHYSLSKEILWESDTATDAEVSEVEVQFIRRLRSNDPVIGYNRGCRIRRRHDQAPASPGFPVSRTGPRWTADWPAPAPDAALAIGRA